MRMIKGIEAEIIDSWLTYRPQFCECGGWNLNERSNYDTYHIEVTPRQLHGLHELLLALSISEAYYEFTVEDDIMEIKMRGHNSWIRISAIMNRNPFYVAYHNAWEILGRDPLKIA